MNDVPPNQTIYINNLNEKLKKNDLKKALYAHFSRYGQILDIVACRAHKLRGQAWIVYKDIAAAGAAMRDLQGFMFYDKPLRINYAKTKSDVISKIDGTYVERKKEDKKRRDEEKKKQGQPSKKQKTESKDSGSSSSGPAEPVILQPRNEPPNHILFVENLPESINEMMLAMLFQQYPGYKEVRLVPGREGKKAMAFVEYETETQAANAMAGLQFFKVTLQDTMVISFAKR
eukprot:TRINITY_DN160_c0_g1_i1.p1 TRINITY_DN160_c0_g1~~TRINITY_DN160_c0_g1_i1.p1  ORF type:complete len:231 (+),score=64.71 TRINITY_DN160_c0_g1_i1:156-848(+)